MYVSRSSSGHSAATASAMDKMACELLSLSLSSRTRSSRVALLLKTRMDAPPGDDNISRSGDKFALTVVMSDLHESLVPPRSP